MKYAFWLALATLVYTYVGYPLLIRLIAVLFPQPVACAPFAGSYSVIIAARNEESNLRRKLPQLQSFLPPDADIIVVDDASTDSTAAVVAELCPRAQLLRLQQSAGKACALNTGIAAATKDVVVFMDARQEVDQESLEHLLTPLSDPNVGAVSGALRIRGTGQHGEALKMDLENRIRAAEGASGSVMGVTGAFYAARRRLLPTLPAGVILDDIYVPMAIIRQGFRVTFAAEANAFDDINASRQQEFRRKVRTLTGNYQLVLLQRWLLMPGNGIFFRFVSHKLLRLTSPFWLILFVLAAPALPVNAAVGVLAMVIAVAGLAALSSLRLPRGPWRKVCEFAGTFTLLNAAALFAFLNFLRGRYQVWGR